MVGLALFNSEARALKAALGDTIAANVRPPEAGWTICPQAAFLLTAEFCSADDYLVSSLAVNDIASFERISRCTSDAIGSLRLHWPEYLMEAGELGSYMFFACAAATLFQHPASPVRHFLANDIWRRLLTGMMMGGIVIAIVMSSWGKQSGAHFNPVVTLTFYRLGKVKFWDALFYIAGQCFGAVAGVALAMHVFLGALNNGAVHYAVTAPGEYGNSVAFLAEVTISFVMMSTALFVANGERSARYTPYIAGSLVATYITIEAPLSGMSMNPARAFGPALVANYWHALWIYFIAPTLGMLGAAEVFLRVRRGTPPPCASCTTQLISAAS